MGERLTFISWNFLKLVCGKHGEPLVLSEGTYGAYYKCPVENCRNIISVMVYEKLIDDIIANTNLEKMVIGFRWKKKIARQWYAFELLSYKAESAVEIGIINLTAIQGKSF